MKRSELQNCSRASGQFAGRDRGTTRRVRGYTNTGWTNGVCIVHTCRYFAYWNSGHSSQGKLGEANGPHGPQVQENGESAARQLHCLIGIGGKEVRPAHGHRMKGAVVELGGRPVFSPGPLGGDEAKGLSQEWMERMGDTDLSFVC